ncbi:MAG: CapA family protein [Propionibacteriaceae bacterium]|nr:CapA family protein [Propionibacteriaceae bacterium]
MSARGTYLFMGDIFFGRYINDWSMASPLQYEYPFSRLGEFDRSAYDAWVANLECPVVAGVPMTSAQMEATLTFNCDPRYLPGVATWFTAVSLGNNHSGNQGAAGLATTRANLEAQGIQYFGSPDPETPPNCNVVVLPVTARMSDGSDKQYPVPFGFCGYDGVFKNPTAAQLQEITQYAQLLPTIAWPHSGAEYKTKPDQIKTALYRDMADAGADMVIGNHAHWVQTTEAYHGKLIVYCMGNFIFDQQSNTEVTRSALIDVTATVDDVAQLAAWSSIAGQCRGDFARCEQLAQSQHLDKLTLSYAYDVRGSNDADKLVKPATPDQLAAIKQRLQWDATMAALGQG